MPTVPTYTDPMDQVKQEALPNVRSQIDAPAEAFGGGQSAKDLESSELGVAKDVTDVAQEFRNRADQTAHLAADTAASQLQTQIQVNVANMKGQDAFAAPDYAEKAWNDGVQKIRSGLNGPNQQLAFDKTSGSRFQDLNKSVQMHVNDQGNAYADQTDQAAIEQARTQAVVNAGDDSVIGKNIELQKASVDNWASRHGIPQDSPAYANKLMSEMSATHRDVVQAKLEAGLDDDAKEYLSNNKDSMTSADFLHAQGALENSEVIGTSQDMFQDVLSKPGMKYGDGTLNGEAIRKYVMENTPDMSSEKQLKVLSQVKAQGAEYNKDRYHTIQNNELDFTNNVVSDRKNGVPIDQAMLRVGSAATGAYDAALKTAFIQKTYAPPEATTVMIHEQLKEGIKNGTVGLDNIDAAMKTGDIGPTEWAELRQLQLKTAADGIDPISKDANKNIQDMAKDKFGSSKEKIDQFNYVLDKKTAGQSPAQKLITAQEELKNVPDPAPWAFFDVPKYKVDYQGIQNQTKAVGAIYNDLGYKQAQAISSGMTKGNPYQRNTDPSENIHSFADSLGVKYEDLKVGTPTNNAVQSLMSKNKQVTPNSVQMVLKKYPDGNWK